MNLSVLIVEDSHIILNHIALLINTLDEPERTKAGIDQIKVDKANCISMAEELFIEAVNKESPYDILILDLSLPKEMGGTDNVRGGLELISKARELEVVRKIMIVSGNFDLNIHVTESFRRGAMNFIRKPYSDKELQQEVLNVVGLLSEQYLSKLNKLVDERIPVLTASVWKSTAYQFSTRIYNLIQTVVYESEELRGEITRRFELDPGKADPLLSHLANIEEVIVDAREDFARLQNGFKEEDEGDEEITIEQELQILARDLFPCVAVKPIQSSIEITRVLSFHNNVRTVLKEILVGGLSEATNSSRTWQVAVEVTCDESMASVRLRDDFPSIDASVAARINEGESILPQTSHFREWGLSLAQHIALRGGGRLIVAPLNGLNDQGNLIIYRIPLA
jgi:CheY-like chemotaxis protein